MILEKPLNEIDDYNHIPGWVDGRILEEIRELAWAKTFVVNVGIWKGKSVAALADVVAGHVYAVDHFRGSPGERDGDHKQATDPLSVYDEYHAYINYLGLAHKIRLFTGTSADIARIYFKHVRDIDLVFVDGDHEADMVWQDLRWWYPTLKPGGVICGDDFNWPGVSKSVMAFSRHHNLELNVLIEGKFWEMRRAL